MCRHIISETLSQINFSFDSIRQESPGGHAIMASSDTKAEEPAFSNITSRLTTRKGMDINMEKNYSWIRMYQVECCWRRIRRLRREIADAVKQGEPLGSSRLMALDEKISALIGRAHGLEHGAEGC